MLTNTMIQNIEQMAAEFAADANLNDDELRAQAQFQLDNEYFDFSLTDDDKNEYIAAYVRGAKSVKQS